MRKDKRLTKERETTTDCNDYDEEDDDVMHYAGRSPARVSICPGAVYCRLLPRICSRLNVVSNIYIKGVRKKYNRISTG